MSPEQPMEPVRVLHGHTDAASAYVVDDYPYGFRLRCTIRYWIETAPKGAKRGQQRFVSQTTNPKVAGEVWNKPEAGTYVALALLYLDGNQHVQWWGTGHHVSAEQDARMRLMGIHDQLNDEQRRRYEGLVTLSQRVNPFGWRQFDEVVTAMAAEISHTGREPQLTNGVWSVPDGRHFHIGDNLAVYLAMARQRLSGDPQ